MPHFTPSSHQPQLPFDEIPYGYCHCGCGQKTNLAIQTDRKRGYIKGQPLRFVYGHHNSANVPDVAPNPGGLCMCGCGELAPLAAKTSTRQGVIKGQPIRFIPYHAVRVRPHPTRIDKFWANVDKRGLDECWEWHGTRLANGYGKLDAEATSQTAHRFSYELHIGPIPDGLQCLHKCDNPPCTNPNHLFLGTHADNVQDKVAKLRHRYGAKHPLAVLTEPDVREIRRLYSKGVTPKEIGLQFGFAATYIGRIVRREIWARLEDEP